MSLIIIDLEAHAHVEEYTHALGVGVAVRISVAVVGVGVDAALLICVGHDVAVVEYVVDIEVDVERHLAVDVDNLTDRGVEREGVFELVLSGELFDFSLESLFGGIEGVEVRQRFVVSGLEVDVCVALPCAVDVEEPALGSGVVDA